MQSSKSQSDLIPSMFVATAVAMIFNQLTSHGAELIDGIIASRALGGAAYSAISLLNPFSAMICLISNAISVGVQVVSSQAVGRGERDRANAAFTLSIIAGVAVSLIFVIMCVLCPNEILKLCGITEASHPEIYSHMSDYLEGCIPGIPFSMLTCILGPIIVMDSDKTLFTVSAFLFFGSNITGNLLNAYVFQCGNFGMGLSTSNAYFLQFLLIMTHFMKKNSYFRTSLKGFESSQIFEMARAASPTFVMKFATVFRDLAINRMNIYVALSAAAIVARGIQNDTNNILFCFPMGMGKTLLTMAGIFYGANDRRGLTHLFGSAVKMTFAVTGTISVIAFIGAEWIASCFTNAPEILELSAFSIRCMALALVSDNLSALFQHYLQAINERKLVNIINFANRFFIPAATAFILGKLFGSKGIMASIAVSEIILIIIIFVMIFVRTGSLRNFLLLPENFGGDEHDNIYASITSDDDVMRESKRAEMFCLKHGVSEDNAKSMSLLVEEVAGNIIAHGKPKFLHRLRADYRLSYSDGKICMMLRDCCGHFDPSAFYEIHREDSTVDMPGLKIIMRLADDVRYFNAFNSNNIMIHIGADKEA